MINKGTIVKWNINNEHGVVEEINNEEINKWGEVDIYVVRFPTGNRTAHLTVDQITSVGEQRWQLNRIESDYFSDEKEYWEKKIGIFNTYEELKDEIQQGYRYIVERLPDLIY